MIKNKSLIALLFGIAIPTVIMPIISDIVEIIDNFSEIIKGYEIKKITKLNIENTKLAEELEVLQTPVATQAIGYEIPSEEDYCEEEECCNKSIGFR